MKKRQGEGFRVTKGFSNPAFDDNSFRADIVGDHESSGLFTIAAQAISHWCGAIIERPSRLASINFDSFGESEGPLFLEIRCRKKTGSMLFLEGEVSGCEQRVLAFTGIVQVTGKAQI